MAPGHHQSVLVGIDVVFALLERHGEELTDEGLVVGPEIQTRILRVYLIVEIDPAVISGETGDMYAFD